MFRVVSRPCSFVYDLVLEGGSDVSKVTSHVPIVRTAARSNRVASHEGRRTHHCEYSYLDRCLSFWRTGCRILSTDLCGVARQGSRPHHLSCVERRRY